MLWEYFRWKVSCIFFVSLFEEFALIMVDNQLFSKVLKHIVLLCFYKRTVLLKTRMKLFQKISIKRTIQSHCHEIVPFHFITVMYFLSNALRWFKRGKNFKWWKFLSPTSNFCYLGQNLFRNVEILKKYWYLDIAIYV